MIYKQGRAKNKKFVVVVNCKIFVYCIAKIFSKNDILFMLYEIINLLIYVS